MGLEHFHDWVRHLNLSAMINYELHGILQEIQQRMYNMSQKMMYACCLNTYE